MSTTLVNDRMDLYQGNYIQRAEAHRKEQRKTSIINGVRKGLYTTLAIGALGFLFAKAVDTKSLDAIVGEPEMPERFEIRGQSYDTAKLPYNGYGQFKGKVITGKDGKPLALLAIER